MIEKRCPVHGTVLVGEIVPVMPPLSALLQNISLPPGNIEDLQERIRIWAADKWPFRGHVVRVDESSGMQAVLYCQSCRDALAERMVGFEERLNSAMATLEALEQRLAMTEDPQSMVSAGAIALLSGSTS